MERALKISEDDNVATLLSDVEKGENVCVVTEGGLQRNTVIARENIKFGNKIALLDINTGENIIKYGAVIGTCYQPIRQGELVHIHNVESNRISIPKNSVREMISSLGIMQK